MYVLSTLLIMKCLLFKKFDFLIVHSNHLLVYGTHWSIQIQNSNTNWDPMQWAQSILASRI